MVFSKITFPPATTMVKGNGFPCKTHWFSFSSIVFLQNGTVYHGFCWKTQWFFHQNHWCFIKFHVLYAKTIGISWKSLFFQNPQIHIQITKTKLNHTSHIFLKYGVFIVFFNDLLENPGPHQPKPRSPIQIFYTGFPSKTHWFSTSSIVFPSNRNGLPWFSLQNPIVLELKSLMFHQIPCLLDRTHISWKSLLFC